jgi:hypothetical protein
MHHEPDDIVRNVGFYADLMEEGAVPLFGIRVLIYVDAQGETQHDFKIDGHVRVGEALGYFEATKFLMWQRAHEEEPG